MSARPTRTLVQTFVWPALLAATTVAALVLGLVSDGFPDVIATIALAVPVVIGAILALGGRR